METTPAPYFHEKSFLFMKQKASYNRVGTFLSYPIIMLLPVLFTYQNEEIYKIMSDSNVILYTLPIYFACVGVLFFMAYRYGSLLQQQGKLLENQQNDVVNYISEYQKYEYRIRQVFSFAFIIFLLETSNLKISHEYLGTVFIMIIGLTYQNNLTKINEWKKSLKA